MKKAKIYMLFSSSKGNCVYIKYGSEQVLIDCGVSARLIEKSLNSLDTSLTNIDAVFITHEHSDHIKGLHTVAKHYRIPIFVPEGCADYISESIMTDSNLIALKSGTAVELKKLAFCPIATPHDARGSVGFRIKAGEEKIGYFTDIGFLSEGVLRGLSGCRRVVIESNYDVNMLQNGFYPYSLKQRILGDRGHLSNELCAKLLPHLVNHGSESFMLAHLSEENNTPEIAYNESYLSLSEKGIAVSKDGSKGVRLRVAPRNGILELV